MLTGDFRSLSEMMRNLNSLGFSVRNRVANHVRDEMNMLLEEQFDQGIDPAGEPWRPLAASTVKRGRHAPPLTDTGDMREHVRAVRHGTDVVINSDLPAGYHQYGGEPGPPKRQIWPNEDEPMPERWETRISYAANEGLLDAMGHSGLKAAE